jgi:hypothetical protein
MVEPLHCCYEGMSVRLLDTLEYELTVVVKDIADPIGKGEKAIEF